MAAPDAKVLMCCSAAEGGASLEDICVIYYSMTAKNFQVDVCSKSGEAITFDEKTVSETENQGKYAEDDVLKGKLEAPNDLNEVDLEQYKCVFFPGGAGCYNDILKVGGDVSLLVAAGIFVACVGLGSTAIVNSMKLDGSNLVADQEVTGLSGAEEVEIYGAMLQEGGVQQILENEGATMVTAGVNEVVVKQFLNCVFTAQNSASIPDLIGAMEQAGLSGVVVG